MKKNPDHSDRRDFSLELSAWLDGELSPAEAAAIDAELARDPELRAERDRLAALSSALHDLPNLRAPSSVLARVQDEISTVPGSFSRFGSWAALFLVALLGFVWWRLEVTRPVVFEGAGLAKEETVTPALQKPGAGDDRSDSGATSSDLSAKSSAAPPTAPPAVEKTKKGSELAETLRRATSDAAPGAEAMKVSETELSEKPPTSESRENGSETQQWSGGAIDVGRAGAQAGAAGERPRDRIAPSEAVIGDAVGGKGAAKSGEEPSRGAPTSADAHRSRITVSAEAIRFRARDGDDLARNASAADLTIRVALPEGIAVADLDRLAAELTARLAPLPASVSGGANINAGSPDTAAPGAAKPLDGGAADTLPVEELLPVEAELAIPPERLLHLIRGVSEWRRALDAAAEEAGAAAGAQAPLERERSEVAKRTEESFYDVTLLDGPSFDADPKTLEAILAALIATPRLGGAPPEPSAPRASDEESVLGSAAGTATSPLRVRIVLVTDRPPEPPR